MEGAVPPPREEALFAERFRSVKRVELCEQASIEVEQAPAVLGAKLDPLGTGSTVWRGGEALALALSSDAALRDLIRGKRVVELGSGTGVAGLAAAALGAKEVLLTDRPELLPLLRRNQNRNAWVRAIGGCSVACAALTWTSELRRFDLAGLVLAELHGPPDCTIAADVCYHQDHVDALAHTVKGLLSLNDSGVAILACDKSHEPLAYAALLRALVDEKKASSKSNNAPSSKNNNAAPLLSCERHSLSDDGCLEIVLVRRR